MRKAAFVPTIPLALALLLSGCAGEKQPQSDWTARYREMSGCQMEAVVSCAPDGVPWAATLRCEYVPEGESVLEVLEPETIAGVRAVLDAETWSLHYAGKRINAGFASPEAISPAAALPHLMDALRNGWLLEESAESWADTPCRRLTLDQSGTATQTLYTTLWLRQDDGTPLRGELAVDAETIFTVEFISFTFAESYDIITES